VNSPIDFALEYRDMSDEQLLQIAGEGGFVDDAKLALQAEMAHRKLTTEMVKSYRSEQQKYEDAQKVGDPNVHATMGTGFVVYGRDYLSEDDRTHGIQVRTKWLAIRGFPIFPVASYRYSCHQVATGLIKWKDEKLIGQVPLYWKQVIRTWLKTIGVFILGGIVVFLFLAWQDKSHK
jgi:hypothetical protein